MSAKAKFNSKHANHPRMRYLNSQEEVVEETSPEVVLQEEVVEKIVVSASPEPEVVLQEKVIEKAPVVLQKEKVDPAPKAAPKRKRVKKVTAKRRRAKKTATQDVTT
tara:strand:+ start:59 stop:379 length:321 start_codon:yes stop_codon:yes gene_type:complete